MIVIPYNTDAPLYHRPYGTLGLIVVNLLIAVLVPLDFLEPFALHYQDGLTPLQWLTSNFVHAGILHVAGNMFFLWGFGLIVEGKLGWYRFIPLYLAIGVMECALEQFLFWGQEGASLGASSAIFGLMAMALIWAPWNEMSIFYWIFIRAGLMEIPVLVFSGLLFLKSILICSFTGIQPTTEVLHLLGAVFGFAFGLTLLHFRWVDCEGWDLWSLMRGRQSSVPLPSELYDRPKPKTSKHKRQTITPEPVDSGTERFARLMQQGKYHAAIQELRQIRASNPAWSPAPEELLQLARAQRKMREWKLALELYKEYLQKSPTTSDPVRIEIAEILILVSERPQAALHVLDSVQTSNLPEKLQQRYTQLQQRAKELLDAGHLEMQEEGWH